MSRVLQIHERGGVCCWAVTLTPPAGNFRQQLFEENVAKVAAIYAKGRYRQWAKAVRELSLGGKDQYFEAAKDSEKLSKIVVVLKNELSSAGLD
ncbi:hypothetical protein CYMTET_30283 [Cymbomonas tetramitiformis]|uniref:Uncharacterized protein n=1 Tax=Cymbomonas tetramitiformis TaxID=36881 RepID=A0AAE0FJU2_9CHLO|nr:hypothetical protein CYMTET_30283 [Cymbomonas tetramitiformis]